MLSLRFYKHQPLDASATHFSLWFVKPPFRLSPPFSSIPSKTWNKFPEGQNPCVRISIFYQNHFTTLPYYHRIPCHFTTPLWPESDVLWAEAQSMVAHHKAQLLRRETAKNSLALRQAGPWRNKKCMMNVYMCIVYIDYIYINTHCCVGVWFPPVSWNDGKFGFYLSW